MRILFVLENYIPHIGGVEVLFKNLAEGLVKIGHEIIIITHRIKGTKKEEIINGVKIKRVSCFGSRYWFTFLSIPSVIKEAKKADIVHAVIFNAAFPAWLAAKITGKPAVLTVNEVWTGKWKELGEMNPASAITHDFLERMIYVFNFDKYVVISKSTKEQLKKAGIKEEKMELIYPGIDYNLFNPKKYGGKKIREKYGLKNNFVYLFFGRPGISKGLEYLIKAVPSISERIPSSKLLAIVSKDKAYRKRYDYMMELIRKLEIKDKIMLVDSVPYENLPNYLKAADCVVVPSLAEGFGFSAAEACAMNVPVVTTNAGSLPEVVSGKYVLIKPKNSEAIAKGVEMIYKNKARKTGKKVFKWDDNIKKHIEIYKRLLK